jgi:1-acyl-sn-glycerol-3-phosphate acyltransferase
MYFVGSDTIAFERRIRYSAPLMEWIIGPIAALILWRRGWRVAPVEGSLPARGPALIAAHHESKSDILATYKLMERRWLIFRKVVRRLFWLADNRPFGRAMVDVPIVRWFVSLAGMIPIDKYDTGRLQNLRDHLFFHLESGEIIGFFPEAHIAEERDGARFGEFRRGVVRLAASWEEKHGSKLPIYPLGFHYSREPGRRLGTIRVRIGEPIFCDGDSRKCHRRLVERIIEVSC